MKKVIYILLIISIIVMSSGILYFLSNNIENIKIIKDKKIIVNDITDNYDSKYRKIILKKENKLQIKNGIIELDGVYLDILSKGINNINAEGLATYGINNGSIIEYLINDNLEYKKNRLKGKDIKIGYYNIQFNSDYIITNISKGNEKGNNIKTDILGKSIFDIENAYIFPYQN